MLDESDKLLARTAVDKIRKGDAPTAREAEALKRFEKDREETRRWDYYRSVPAKHYQQMSGRAARVLIDQQAKWGIPVGGRTVDMTAVARWTHNFIADNAQRLLAAESVPEGASRALERYRNAMAEEKELELATKRDDLFNFDEVRVVGAKLIGALTRCVNNLETTIPTEFDVWLGDPAVAAMPSHERRRMVREYIEKTVRTARQALSDDLYKHLVAERKQELPVEDAAAAKGAEVSNSLGMGP